MRVGLIALFGACLLGGAGDRASAQTAPTGEDASCGRRDPVTTETLGRSTQSYECAATAARTGDDYVVVNVFWVPAQNVGLNPAQAGTAARRGRPAWRQIVEGIRRAAVFKVDETGVVTLRIFRARSGLSATAEAASAAGTWQRCGANGFIYNKDEYDLVLIRPLTAWKVSEGDGFSTEGLSSALSGRQIFEFPADGARLLDVELCISHVRTVTPAFIANLRRLVDLATATGRDSALISDAFLTQIGNIEQEIATQANFASGIVQSAQIGWRAGEVQRIDLDVGLPWEREAPGATAVIPSRLTVSSEISGSLFSGPHTYSGSGTSFSFAGGRAPVLAQKITTMTVEEALDSSLIRIFSDDTVSPTVWEENCKLLERRLAAEPLRQLNGQDTQAVIWAVMGSQARLGAEAVRAQPCSRRLVTSPDRLAAFAASNLSIDPPTPDAPSGAYDQVYRRALETVASAGAVAGQARERRAALVPQSYTTFEPAVGGQFSGTIAENGLGSGRIQYTDPGYEGAVWEGEVRREGSGVVAHGMGTFSYASAFNAANGCVAPRVTTFFGLAQFNQMRTGEIVYCDNAIFSGTLNENEEPTFGRMRFAPNQNFIRLLYGEFSGRRFGIGGPGVEETREIVSGDARIRGYRSGTWVDDNYLGQ